MDNAIYIAMPVSGFFGAGVCGLHLLKEFSKRRETFYVPVGEEMLDEETHDFVTKRLRTLSADVDAPLLQFVTPPDFDRVKRFRGSPNVGYVCFEQESLTARQVENLRAFDVLVATSEWCAAIVNAHRLECVSVPQGVDRSVFKPMPRIAAKDKFVIYSGGKYEHRKAQDLVIRATTILQQRHPDILLMASWMNIFDDKDPYEFARRCGVKLVGLPLLSQPDLANHMNQSDVGLFPNRCEGATNLVMMEYLACGKPVVANVSTGQRDVLRPAYSYEIDGGDQELIDKMIEDVEILYQNRDLAAAMGQEADFAMNAWHWTRTADGIARAMEPVYA